MSISSVPDQANQGYCWQANCCGKNKNLQGKISLAELEEAEEGRLGKHTIVTLTTAEAANLRGEKETFLNQTNKIVESQKKLSDRKSCCYRWPIWAKCLLGLSLGVGLIGSIIFPIYFNISNSNQNTNSSTSPISSSPSPIFTSSIPTTDLPTPLIPQCEKDAQELDCPTARTTSFYDGVFLRNNFRVNDLTEDEFCCQLIVLEQLAKTNPTEVVNYLIDYRNAITTRFDDETATSFVQKINDMTSAYFNQNS